MILLTMDIALLISLHAEKDIWKLCPISLKLKKPVWKPQTMMDTLHCIWRACKFIQ